ncbi:MAG: copper resistance protein B [Novosphingobium meiothermophilum]
MKRVSFAALMTAAGLVASAPALAQDASDPHAGHDMGAMGAMDHSVHQMPAAVPAGAPDPHAGHDMGAMDQAAQSDEAARMDHSTQTDHSAHMDHAAASAIPDSEVGNAPPPPVPTDHPADAFWDRARMMRARAALSREGAFFGNALILDRMEHRSRNGKDGYAWEATGWIGNDYDRLAFDTQGEGTYGEPLERAEVWAAWRHAFDPWWNFELGVRQDLGHGPDRTYAVAGFRGLAPYWFEVGAHAFVSNKGDVHLRIDAEHDMRLTQRLIFQPAIEIDVAAQDVPELGIGAGIEKIELGARVRYEFAREFAPYVGVHWERKLGRTAGFARTDGESPSQVSAVVGLRMWF